MDDNQAQTETTVMIVDDVPENLMLLEALLREKGYRVQSLPGGEFALKVAANRPPDIILLDINMPQMDGYEVCRRLKAQEELKDIPVLFLSALDDPIDKVKAFAAGGVDYIAKPFHFEEVGARVAVHLELRKAREELKQQNRILRENLQLREQIEGITAHDLKSPLNPIVVLPGLIRKLGPLTEKQALYLDAVERAGREMLALITISLDLLKIEQGTYAYTPADVDLLEILRGVKSNLDPLARPKGVSIRILCDGRPVGETDHLTATCEQLLTCSMFSNLIKNAIEASPADEAVVVSVERTGGISVRIHNKGTVPAHIRDRFFDKYVTCGKQDGTGLGTYSARLMARAQGADLQLDVSDPTGTSLRVRFAG